MDKGRTKGRSIRRTKGRSNKSHKSIRKTHSKKGGSYCVFEHPESFNVDYKNGNKNCKDNHCEPCIQTRNYFYFLHNMTLFAFTSHIFKHLDTIHDTTQPSNNICSHNSAKTRRIRFSTNYDSLDGNLPELIHNMQQLIANLDLSHEILKQNKIVRGKTNGKYYITNYKGYTFFWDKHKMPTRPVQYRDDPMFIPSLLTCVNIMHINKSIQSESKCNTGLGTTKKSNMDNQPGNIEGVSPIKSVPALFIKQHEYNLAVDNKRKYVVSAISKKAAKISSSSNTYTNITSIKDKLNPPPKFHVNDIVLYNRVQYTITDVFIVDFDSTFVYNLTHVAADVAIYVPESELTSNIITGPSMKISNTTASIFPEAKLEIGTTGPSMKIVSENIQSQFNINTIIQYTKPGKTHKVFEGRITNTAKAPAKYTISIINKGKRENLTVDARTISRK